MRIDVLGVRGSRPTPGAGTVRYGGDTPCIALSPDQGRPAVLLDAGTGITHTASLLAGEPFRGSILLGHLHWDHVEGLPFFRNGDRLDARVDLWLPRQELPAVQALTRFMSPPIFPIAPSGLNGSWRFLEMDEGEHEIEGFRVLALEIPHKGGRTFGFRVERDGVALAYLSDHSPTSLGPGPDGLGEYHPAAVRLAHDVDLLIHDSQYTPEEFAATPDWGHCTMDYPVALGRVAGAARVLLFHHDPRHDDDFLESRAAGLPKDVEFAVQGSRIEL